MHHAIAEITLLTLKEVEKMATVARKSRNVKRKASGNLPATAVSAADAERFVRSIMSEDLRAARVASLS